MPQPALTAADHAVDHARDGARHRASAGAPRDLLAKARPRTRRQRRAHPYELDRRRGPAGDPRPGEPMELSKPAQHFFAGVLHHMPAICAITAPSPVSYLRLTPNAWAPTVIDLVRQDRGATLRICPIFAAATPDEVTRQFHVEFRATDAAASPYLALGAMIFAGVDGIRRGLELPTSGPPEHLPHSLPRRSTGSPPARRWPAGSARPISTPICGSSASRRRRSPAFRRPSSAPATPRSIDARGSAARARRARSGHARERVREIRSSFSPATMRAAPSRAGSAGSGCPSPRPCATLPGISASALSAGSFRACWTPR